MIKKKKKNYKIMWSTVLQDITDVAILEESSYICKSFTVPCNDGDIWG